MVPALQVANSFLCLCDEDAGDVISNLKLQKLLYYAQGIHLAKFGTPLFPEEIKAWMHGPVVPEIYHHFKARGNNGLPRPPRGPALPKATQDFINSIYNVYGQYSAWKLRNFTHDEPPWRNTASSREISHRALIDYFKTQLA
jgi:uncharacterized phage-associated protein